LKPRHSPLIWLLIPGVMAALGFQILICWPGLEYHWHVSHYEFTRTRRFCAVDPGGPLAYDEVRAKFMGYELRLLRILNNKQGIPDNTLLRWHHGSSEWHLAWERRHLVIKYD
jgi:hypothetical protein